MASLRTLDLTMTRDSSGDGKDDTIKSLVEYCKSLQSRLKELESDSKNRTEKNSMRTPGNQTRCNKNSLKTSSPRQQFAPKSPSHLGSTTRTSIGGSEIEPLSGRADLNSSAFPQRIVKWKDNGMPEGNCKTDNTKSNSRASNISTSISESIDRTVDDLNEKVFQLKHLFNTTDPIVERKAAVIKIQSHIRGFICRCRLTHFNGAIRDWKWSRCGSLIRVMENGLGAAAKIESKLRQMAMAKAMRRKLLIFSKWMHVVRQAAPMRRYVREAAEQKGHIKDQQLLRSVFLALYDACIGKCSNKFARKERRLLIEKIRRDLSEKQQHEASETPEGKEVALFPGVVSESDVYRELYRHILTGYHAKKNLQITQDAFYTFKSVYDRSKVLLKKGLQKRFRTLAGKCFYAWSDWIFMVGQGLDRKRWSGPRKYEVRYNQKVIDVFGRNRLQRVAFHPWRRYARQRSEAERRFRNKLAAFIGRHFLAWRDKAQFLRHLRIDSVESWTGYARLVMTHPFSCWVKYAESAQTKRIQQDRLVKTYIRWKIRQKMSLIMRTWRHQAVYGRVEGMYTRNMLSRSLGEQKLLSTSLQRMLTTQTVELEECRDLVNREIELRKAVERKVVAKDDEILRYQIVNDHRDQELRRLEAIIEVQHLKDMQLEFKFKKRLFDYNTNAANALKFGILDDDDNSTTVSTVTEASRTGGSASKAPGRRGSDANRYTAVKVESKEDQVRDPQDLVSDLFENSSDSPAEIHPQLSDLDMGLLLRAKWLVSLYSQADPQRATKVAAEVIAANTTEKSIPETMRPASVLTVATPTKIAHADSELVVSQFVLSLLAFLEKGDTQCLSSADKKAWMAQILSSVRPVAEHDNTVASKGNNGTLARPGSVSKAEEPSWRDVLVNLRSMYPVSDGDRLELGLSNRIIGLRSLLTEVTKSKTARQQRRAKLAQGLPLDEEDVEEPPNVYAANISNMVREVNRRMMLEDDRSELN